MSKEKSNEDKVIRLSLSWLTIGLIAITALGILGGVFGQQLVQQPLPALTGPTERLVSTVQEVTISPNTSSANIVKDSERSILSITKKGAEGESEMIATGLVVTNDGMVVTPARVGTAPLMAILANGEETELTLIGTDTIYGLSYWRLKEGVFVPLEIQREDAPVATELLALSRSENTFLNKVASYRINEYILPSGSLPIGIQKFMKSDSIAGEVLEGSPLIDDEGKIAGLLFAGPLGIAIPASGLLESMNRVIDSKHTINPFVETGITPAFSFKANDNSTARQFTVSVSSVVPRSPASIAGVKPADVILEIDGKKITWSDNFTNMISRELPFQITVLRLKEKHTLTLNRSLDNQ